ncbi:MAG: toll/interleukin-1 receptor domain-containing protein, partial [Clostridia bacterium]|nr:toll/interleukin-1 receptor domain-containing protein [Clostridia bacterium]
MKLRCFLCATEYEAERPSSYCPCCHIRQDVNDGDIGLYRGLYEASANMRQRRFNKARHIYLGLTRAYPESFYAFFGFCAAKYGILYEKASATSSDYSAVCLSALSESFTDAPSFKKACELCPGHSIEQLKHLGELAEESRAALVKKANMLPAYDVFLSIQYSETDRNYDRTADRLYYKLTEQGLRVFFEPQVIPEANDVQAAPFVYRALQTCSQMLVYVSEDLDFSGFRIQN